MGKHYLITKDNKIVAIKYEDLQGLSFKPLNDIFVDDGVIVVKIVIFKPEFIELVLKKKIKNKLNLYLNLLLSSVDDSDGDQYTRDLYMDITKYRSLVLNRYRKYLDEKYLEMLLMKISIIEEEVKANMYTPSLETKTR